MYVLLTMKNQSFQAKNLMMTKLIMTAHSILLFPNISIGYLI